MWLDSSGELADLVARVAALVAEQEGATGRMTDTMRASAGELDSLLNAYRAALTPQVAERILELRGWTPEAIRQLELGYDGKRVVLPVRDESCELVGFTRYQPNPALRDERQPKMRADAGTTRSLSAARVARRPRSGRAALPRRRRTRRRPLLVGRHPAVAVPGSQAWRSGWAARFARPHLRIVVCFDADQAGRKAAAQARVDLAGQGIDARLLDLAPDRDDGLDLSDLLNGAHTEADRAAAASLLREMAHLAPVAPITSPRSSAMTDRERPAFSREKSEISEESPSDDPFSRFPRFSHRKRVGGAASRAGRDARAGGPVGRAWTPTRRRRGRGARLRAGRFRERRRALRVRAGGRDAAPPERVRALVGPTATARKGEAMRLGIRPVRLADEGWNGRVSRGFGSGEAIV